MPFHRTSDKKQACSLIHVFRSQEKKLLKFWMSLYIHRIKYDLETQIWKSVMFKWSILRQNAAGALGMLQHNSFRLRILWANGANTPITHSLPRHCNLIFTVNIISLLYVVSKCIAVILKLLKILILLLIALRNASGILSFLIAPLA